MQIFWLIPRSSGSLSSAGCKTSPWKGNAARHPRGTHGRHDALEAALQQAPLQAHSPLGGSTRHYTVQFRQCAGQVTIAPGAPHASSSAGKNREIQCPTQRSCARQGRARHTDNFSGGAPLCLGCRVQGNCGAYCRPVPRFSRRCACFLHGVSPWSLAIGGVTQAVDFSLTLAAIARLCHRRPTAACRGCFLNMKFTLPT